MLMNLLMETILLSQHSTSLICCTLRTTLFSLLLSVILLIYLSSNSKALGSICQYIIFFWVYKEQEIIFEFFILIIYSAVSAKPAFTCLPQHSGSEQVSTSSLFTIYLRTLMKENRKNLPMFWRIDSIVLLFSRYKGSLLISFLLPFLSTEMKMKELDIQSQAAVQRLIFGVLFIFLRQNPCIGISSMSHYSLLVFRSISYIFLSNSQKSVCFLKKAFVSSSLKLESAMQEYASSLQPSFRSTSLHWLQVSLRSERFRQYSLGLLTMVRCRHLQQRNGSSRHLATPIFFLNLSLSTRVSKTCFFLALIQWSVSISGLNCFFLLKLWMKGSYWQMMFASSERGPNQDRITSQMKWLKLEQSFSPLLQRPFMESCIQHSTFSMKQTLMSTSLSFLSSRSFILISFMISGCLQSISYKIAITLMNYCSEHENLQRIKSPILSVSRSTEERRYFSASLAAFLEASLGTLSSTPMSLFTYLNMYWLAISLILAAQMPTLVSCLQYFAMFCSSAKSACRQVFSLFKNSMQLAICLSQEWATKQSCSLRSMSRLMNLPPFILNLQGRLVIASSAFSSFPRSYSPHLVRIRSTEESLILKLEPSMSSSEKVSVPGGTFCPIRQSLLPSYLLQLLFFSSLSLKLSASRSSEMLVELRMLSSFDLIFLCMISNTSATVFSTAWLLQFSKMNQTTSENTSKLVSSSSLLGWKLSLAKLTSLLSTFMISSEQSPDLLQFILIPCLRRKSYSSDSRLSILFIFDLTLLLAPLLPVCGYLRILFSIIFRVLSFTNLIISQRCSRGRAPAASNISFMFRSRFLAAQFLAYLSVRLPLRRWLKLIEVTIQMRSISQSRIESSRGSMSFVKLLSISTQRYSLSKGSLILSSLASRLRLLALLNLLILSLLIW